MIDKLRARMKDMNAGQLEQLLNDLKSEKYKFYTILGQDFREEVESAVKARQKSGTGKKTSLRKGSAKTSDKKESSRRSKLSDAELEASARELLRNRERRRHRIILTCVVVAALSLGYFGIYTYHEYRTSASYSMLNKMKESAKESGSSKTSGADDSEVVIHYTEDGETPEVLEEYKSLLIKNKKLIGWVKIADTNIDYPVMQTSDNEYYLTHNIDQEKDRNGTIFMDTNCDVLKPSTNFILYGHHMRSGNMFGKLDKYEDEDYCKEHNLIQFDTIYEHGTYEVMYVFRSHVFKAEDVSFKYYQFIDAYSEVEFDSYMKEMAEMSLFDTGVTASYGDQLLTLSTCDYEEENGRFVVVAKRIE
jgi:SrtB family sortase